MQSGSLAKTNELTLVEAPNPAGYPYYQAPVAPPTAGWQEYWHILLKRRRTIFLTTLGLVALVGLACVVMRPTYQATTRIVFYPSGPSMDELKNFWAENDNGNDYATTLETHAKLLGGETLEWNTIQTLQLGKEAAFTNGKQLSRERLLKKFEDNLSISKDRNTRVIEVSFDSKSPELAAKTVNTLSRLYIEQNFRNKFENATQTSTWLKDQLSGLQKQVEASQQAMVLYQKEHGILGTDDKQRSNIVEEKLYDLDKALTDAEADRIAKEARYRATLSNNAELIAQIEPNTLIEKLRASEADLKTQYAQASTQMGPAHPRVQELQNQIQAIEQTIHAEVSKMGSRIKGDYSSALQREKMLREDMEAQKAKENEMNEAAIEYNLLKHRYETNRDLYDQLLKTMNDAALAAGLKANNIQIVDYAAVPERPVIPRIPRYLAVAFAAGLMLGVVFAFTQEKMDPTVRTPLEAEIFSELPALGVIPLSLPARKNGKLNGGKKTTLLETDIPELIAHCRPNSEVSESYRALRTSLLFSNKMDAPPKVILFSSALAREGKTTTSINSAIVLAQRGKRVLLIDGDMRQPSLHQKTGVGSEAGLSTVLTGVHEPAHAIVSSEAMSRWVPSLHILPAGPVPANPTELLDSQMMRELLIWCRTRYDHVIIDSPPALVATDPVLLSLVCDGVVLVIRAGNTPREAVAQVRSLFLQVNARILGVVLNAVDFRSDAHSYRYWGNYSRARGA